MAIQDHLKIASAEMMKAADLLRQEINDLRSEDAALKRRVVENTARLTAEIQLREQEVRTVDDPNLRGQGQTTINHLTRQIADAKSQLGKDQQRIQDIIRQKEQQIVSIDQQARSIQP